MNGIFFTLIFAIYELLAQLVKTGKAEIIVLCILIPTYFTLSIIASFRNKKIDPWSLYHHRYYHLAAYLFILYLTVFDISIALQKGYEIIGVNVFYNVRTVKFIIIAAWIIEAVSSSMYSTKNFDSKDIDVKIFAKDIALVGSFLIIDSSTTLIFFIGVEAISFATYALLASEKRVEATSVTIYYFLYSVIGSLLICLGFLALYIESGQISMSITHFVQAGVDGYTTRISALLFLVGLFIKLGIGPFYHWTPLVYEEIKASNFILISVLLKIPLFGAVFIIRSFSFLTNAVFVQIVMMIIVYGLVMSLAELSSEKKLRKILAYSSAANISIVVGGILINNLHPTAALYFMAIYSISFTTTFQAMVLLNSKMLEEAESKVAVENDDSLLRTSVVVSLVITSGLPLITVFVFKMYLLGSIEVLRASPLYNSMQIANVLMVLFLFTANIIVYKAYFTIIKDFIYGDENGEVPEELYTKLSYDKTNKVYGVCNMIFIIFTAMLILTYF